MAKAPIRSKYVSIEASEESSELSCEDLDDIPESVIPQRDWSKITRELEERYASIPDDEDIEEEEEGTVEHGIKQSSLVPRNTSPRLFIVRVQRNSEREIMMRIIHNEPRNVFSIVCKDGLKGYLYVEAFQKQHVIDALESLRGVSRTRISVVPQREMIEAMTYREQEVFGEWGRIKKGKYKNDLVRIIGVDEEMVKIRAIPRIDGIRNLFKSEDFKSEEIIKSRGYSIYRRDMYIDGFLEKEVLKSSIDFDIDPTFAELEEFKQSCGVCIGDKVRVSRGELIGMTGVVKSINGMIARIEGNEGMFEVESSGLIKHFEVGENVSYKGENGVIVKIDDKEVIIAMRDFTEELKMNIDELSGPTVKKPRVEKKSVVEQRRRVVRDPLINKEVQIQSGEHKGYNGIVKEVDKDLCRIQLNSNMRFVNVKRNSIGLVNYESVDRMRYDESVGYKTPGYKTPGYKTPGYKTPGYKTPSVATDDFEIEWLKEDDNPYKGALIKVFERELTLEDCKNDLFVTKDGVFTIEEVSFVQPQKNDLICVLDGERRGINGILIAINGDSGVVRSSTGPVIHLPMDQISKKIY